jgi:hypothetical protein
MFARRRVVAPSGGDRLNWPALREQGETGDEKRNEHAMVERAARDRLD